MFLELLHVFFMVEVKEDDTVIRDGLAVFTVFLLPLIFLAAPPAPVIDDPVVPAADILFETTPVNAVHFAVGIIRIGKQAVNHLHDAAVAARIAVFYLLKFPAEKFAWFKEIGFKIHNGR